MNDLRIGQGETIRQTVTVEEEGAATATFIATDGNTNIIEEEATFDGMTADISTTDTIVPIGSYDYYIKIEWDDGSVDYVPNFADCEDECELPQLIVCEVPGVS